MATSTASNTAAAATPAVSPTSKVDSFVKALLDPDQRKSAAEKLDTEASELEARLAQVRAARAALDSANGVTHNGGDGEEAEAAPAPASRPRRVAQAGSARPGRPAKAPASTGKRGRPAGPGAAHGPAIIAVLKGKRNGMNRAELLEALKAAKHKIAPGILSTYLNKMSTAEQLVVSGEPRSYVYSLPKSK